MDFPEEEEGGFAPEADIQFESNQQPDFFAQAADGQEAIPDVAPAYSAPALGAPISVPVPDTNPLLLFNAKFRALGEEKDAKEREAKAQRKTAGKAALKSMLGERAAAVQVRKAKNRDDEAQKERELLDGLEGESWGRVASLIDVHSVVASSEKKKPGDAVEPDMVRQKDLLISLSRQPLPTATH